MKMRLLVLLPIFILTACGVFYENKNIEWQVVQPEEYPVLVAVGYAPISTQPGVNRSQKIMLALRASKLDAYRELAEQVYGQRINSNTVLQDMVQQNAQLESSVSGLIRGARVKESYPVGDLYATELELDMKRVYEIYLSTSMPQKIKKVSYY